MPNATLTRARAGGSLASFEVLVRKVREMFVLGQQRIEWEKVRTYWKTGWYIKRHVLLNKDRAELGDRTIQKLGERLGVDPSVLGRLKLFAERYPVLATWPKLTWSHFRLLIPIEDDKTRLELTERANRGAWSTDKLESVIRNELRYEAKLLTDARKLETFARGTQLLKPKLGALYTYRLIESQPVQANPGRLKVDLGFRVHQTEFTMRGNLKAGQIVESQKQENGTYTVVSSKRDESSLYTYKAWVARVVDGDTQFVEIDLGFSIALEQYLRLRGIDAPEISTAEGKKAKAFVEKCLRTAPFILFTSSRSDKFDRYLSDVFVPLDSKSPVHPAAPEASVTYENQQLLYLNNELLLRGLARRITV